MRVDEKMVKVKMLKVELATYEELKKLKEIYKVMTFNEVIKKLLEHK
jgi:predicted CopG family antitoxin